VHESIGVLGAVSVATACVLPGSIAADIAQVQRMDTQQRVDVEHPTGFFTVDMQLEVNNGNVKVRRSTLLRTARKLMSGELYVPRSVWQP
jgi:4-oxalomesaconate tautomerase